MSPLKCDPALFASLSPLEKSRLLSRLANRRYREKYPDKRKAENRKAGKISRPKHRDIRNQQHKARRARRRNSPFILMAAASKLASGKSPATDSRIAEFCALVNAGIESWSKAGRLFVEILDADPDARRKIKALHPWINESVLDGFERIGRKQVYHYLMVDHSPGARKLLTLPFSEQERLYGAEIALAVRKGSELETKPMRISQLSYREAELAFSATGPRTIAEQMKLLRPKQKIRENAHDPEPDYQAPAFVSSGTIMGELATAQAALLRARELQGDSPLDRFITTALTAIGKLRLELQEAE